MRLDKFLAEKGLGTRTEIKNLLSKGVVSVNGKIIKLAKYQLAEDEREKVSYQGELLSAYKSRVFVLNKPLGVLSSSNDIHVACALDFLPKNLQTRKYSCIGRLDKYSEGLLLLSNDGELIHRLTKPKWEIKKLYRVEFTPELKMGEAELISMQFASGLRISNLDCKPAVFKAIDAHTAEVTVSEGKFHQVRRMLVHFGHEVTRLIRLQEGCIELGEMKSGDLRELSSAEYLSLYAEVKLERC